MAAFLGVVAFTSRVHGQIGGSTLSQLNTALMSLLPEPVIDPLTDPPGQFHAVKPQEFDPAHTNLVQAAWLNGIGCPTNAFIALPNASFTGVGMTMGFTDDACPTGYDIRKLGLSTDPLGSHCGAGAPRFDVVTSDGAVHFLGCSSPSPTTQQPSTTGWIRLRWNTAGLAAAFPPILPADIVKRIVIIFDEGQDPSGGPDQFGGAILDNIDVNGTLVGHGATDAS
ncbi:MAG: hypothetical protein DMF93_23825 [Acidobacteria bacterium]|nr:MAG: hypothetical protein DMF93_23825 [Acidobacteriota bacterium]